MKLDVIWICSCRKQLLTSEVKKRHMGLGHTIVGKKIAKHRQPYLAEGVTNEEVQAL